MFLCRSYIFRTVYPGTNRRRVFERGMRVVLCETEEGREKKNPVCMPLPGTALQGFAYERVTVHVCVYFGEITMGGCVFTPAWQKIILLTVWKINDTSLSLAWLVQSPHPLPPHPHTPPPSTPSPRAQCTWTTWWRSDSTPNPRVPAVTLGPVLT